MNSGFLNIYNDVFSNTYNDMEIIHFFCDFLQNNPPEGKELRTNKIPGHRDISSISFP